LVSLATVTLPPRLSAHQEKTSFGDNRPPVPLATASGHCDRTRLRAEQQKAARLSALRDLDEEMAIGGAVDVVPGPCPSTTGTLTAKRAREAEDSRGMSTEEGKSIYERRPGWPSVCTGSTIGWSVEQDKIEAQRVQSQGMTSLSADMTRCANPVDVEFKVDDDLRADRPVAPIHITTPGPYFETFSGTSRGPDPEGDYSGQKRTSREVYRFTRRGRGIEKVDSKMLTRGERSRTRSRSGDGNYCGRVQGIGEFW